MNLADTGFGYSQVLPIVAQLWATRSRRRGPFVAPLIAIEQPELHLHPAHQGELASVFASLVAGNRPDGWSPRIVAETHSDTLINRIGELVASEESALTKEHVQIVIFDHSPSDSESKLSFAHYSKDGGLLGWPFGFLSA